MKQLLLVGMGGFVGSVLRYLVSKINFQWQVLSLPLGTLTVNVLGSFIIGLVMGMSIKSALITSDLKLLLIVGFCGGFTTFSAFSNENILMIQNGQAINALIYTVVSILLGFLSVYFGYFISNIG